MIDKQRKPAILLADKFAAAVTLGEVMVSVLGAAG